MHLKVWISDCIETNTTSEEKFSDVCLRTFEACFRHEIRERWLLTSLLLRFQWKFYFENRREKKTLWTNCYFVRAEILLQTLTSSPMKWQFARWALPLKLRSQKLHRKVQLFFTGINNSTGMFLVVFWVRRFRNFVFESESQHCWYFTIILQISSTGWIPVFG